MNFLQPWVNLWLLFWIETVHSSKGSDFNGEYDVGEFQPWPNYYEVTLKVASETPAMAKRGADPTKDSLTQALEKGGSLVEFTTKSGPGHGEESPITQHSRVKAAKVKRFHSHKKLKSVLRGSASSRNRRSHKKHSESTPSPRGAKLNSKDDWFLALYK